MKTRIFIFPIILVLFSLIFAPQPALSDTYTAAYWGPEGVAYSTGNVYPNSDGDCIAYLRESYFPYPDDPIYSYIRYVYEDAEIKAYLMSEKLELGIFNTHANETVGNTSSIAKAIAQEEFTVSGPGGLIDALMNFEIDGTLYITDKSEHLHQNNLRVVIAIKRVADNQIVGLYDKSITVWNDPTEPTSPGYGYINWIGGVVEFVNYNHDPYDYNAEPFSLVPGNGKMLIFDSPISVPVANLEMGVEYYYRIEIRNLIFKQGGTDTFHTLKFSSDLPPMEFGCFDGEPQPENFIPEDNQEVFTVRSELGALGEEQNGDLTVLIDIKPGSDINKINLKSKGVIPVAILTTEDFDATTINPETVQFGPYGVLIAHEKYHMEDIDCDGDLDALFHFDTQEADFQCGVTEANLTGQTYDGQNFSGTDAIVILDCKE